MFSNVSLLTLSSSFDLPPSRIAEPLPVNFGRVSTPTQKPLTLGTPKPTKKRKLRKLRSGHDDTPRAFKRLMAIAPGTDRTRGTGDHVADTKPAKPGRANKELPK